LRSNHSQTVDLGFEAQPRNPRSSSPRARCRSHTAPPNLSIARPPSTRPVRPSPILFTRSPTPTTILVAAHHAAPATCTPRDKQTQFSKRNKGKRKTKQNYPRFKFKLRQVNDSSHSNQRTDHLVSQIERVSDHTFGCNKEQHALRIKNDLQALVDQRRAVAPRVSPPIAARGREQ
jgi:hypothetical protein